MTEPDIHALPETLAIFPLTGVLLLPGAHLPLHIFEPRYRAMTEDAITGAGFIGLVQPRNPDAADQRGEREGEAEPAVYDVGCVGHILRCQKLPDGRYILILEGIRRFRIQEELALHRGYRRVRPDFGEFEADRRSPEIKVDRERVIPALSAFAASHRLELELERLEQLDGLALLNSLAMALPFQPAEKQALLEAATVGERLEVLLSLMAMGIDPRPGEGEDEPPVAH